MDGDSRQQQNQTMGSNDATSFRDILQPVWLRSIVQNSPRLDRFLLGYGRYFLWPFGLMLYFVLLISKIQIQ